jgi:protease-4
MIDVTYQQFVTTIAQARHLEVETVKTFADGRVFTGEQALALGVVDRLGTEEDARRWACELVGLNPDKTTTFLIEEPKSLVNRVLSRNQSHFIQQMEFELLTNGHPLWLYRP